MDEIWNKRREKLQNAVSVAALELFAHMGGAESFECELGHGLKLAIGPDASMSPSQERERVLAALGHEPTTRPDCRAEQQPPVVRKPGPPSPPRYCRLKAGHEGPHRDPWGDLREPIQMRESLPICRTCRTRWPCPPAQTVLNPQPQPAAPDPKD